LPIEDTYFELLADTLGRPRFAAAVNFFSGISRDRHLDLRGSESVHIWRDALAPPRAHHLVVVKFTEKPLSPTSCRPSAGLLRVSYSLELTSQEAELNAVTDP